MSKGWCLWGSLPILGASFSFLILIPVWDGAQADSHTEFSAVVGIVLLHVRI